MPAKRDKQQAAAIIDIDGYVTIQGAAKYLSISEQSVRRLINAGSLPAYRPVPGRIVISKSDLDDFVKKTRLRV